MASKRVSLKGKGADLFFGGTAAETALPQPAPDRDPEAGPEAADVPVAPIDRAPSLSDLESPSERTNERTNVATFERTKQRTTGRSDEPPGERDTADRAGDLDGIDAERARVRHSFDVYRDQLLALGDIQTARHRRTGRKPKLGELVQEALDAYIAQHARTNERTNERSTNSRSRR